MILYSNAFNSAGERVRIALALKGLPYEYVSVQDIGWDAYAHINPQALLPTLRVDDGLIMQSTAILEYLEELYPQPPLLPRDPFLRAQARAFGQAIASEMHAVDVLRTRQFLSRELGVDKSGIERWTDHWFEQGIAALEGFLSLRTQRFAYCFGDDPGWAEVFLVPQLRKSVQRYFLDISDYPQLKSVYERCLALPAFEAAAPERQPDFQRARNNITIRGVNDGPPDRI